MLNKGGLKRSDVELVEDVLVYLRGVVRKRCCLAVDGYVVGVELGYEVGEIVMVE